MSESRGRRQVRWWYFVLALFGVAWVWFYWPFLNPHWDQDRCAFGTVSNEQYRDMFAALRPKARAVIEEIQVSGNRPSPKNRNVSLALGGYVGEALKDKFTPDEKVAAMHAAVRALGAWHIGSENTANFTGIRYTYGVHVRRIFHILYNFDHIFSAMFQIFSTIIVPLGDLRIDFSATNPSGGSTRIEHLQHVLVFKRTLKYSPISIYENSESCPPLHHNNTQAADWQHGN